MRNTYSLIFVMLVALACTSKKQNESGQADSKLTFVFSKQVSVTVADLGDNLCLRTFHEAAVINADPANSGRRLFTLSEGPHKVLLDYGNIVSAFVLEKKGNKVEVSTSDNFPMCFSKHSNFSLGTDGISLFYDNQKEIKFKVELVSLPNGIQIALEFEPEVGYGLVVRR